YDLSATTFSPDGKIFQVEYATKAVENSGTAMGVRCKDGVLLAVEKLLISKMLVAGSNRQASDETDFVIVRVHGVSKHVGMAVAGLSADARQIVYRGRDEVAGYIENYGSQMPPSMLADRLAQYVHYFTLHGSLRPFGASVLVAGYDAELKKHELYVIEPSGVMYRYFGAAVGKGRQAAKTEMEKLKFDDMTCKEAMKQVCKILHVLHDEAKDKPFELEMSWVCEESGWKYQAVPQAQVKEAEEWAKQSIESDEMDDDED
ncbi:unnamed protein product, partial [Ectocarpus sp. 13 AM-2016]